MTKGITNKEQDPEIVYADIFHHTRWQSPARPHMSLYDRAAQFAPFAALTGYEDMVREEARETSEHRLPEEWEQEKLNEKLKLISETILEGNHPTLSITYFVPDTKKTGVEYVTVTEKIKKIDIVNRKIILMKSRNVGRNNPEIDIDEVTDIYGDLVNHLDNIPD